MTCAATLDLCLLIEQTFFFFYFPDSILICLASQMALLGFFLPPYAAAGIQTQASRICTSRETLIQDNKTNLAATTTTVEQTWTIRGHWRGTVQAGGRIFFRINRFLRNNFPVGHLTKARSPENWNQPPTRPPTRRGRPNVRSVNFFRRYQIPDVNGGPDRVTDDEEVTEQMKTFWHGHYLTIKRIDFCTMKNHSVLVSSKEHWLGMRQLIRYFWFSI